MLKLNRGLIVLVVVTVLSVACLAVILKPFWDGLAGRPGVSASSEALASEVKQLLDEAASSPSGPIPAGVSAAHPWLRDRSWELAQEMIRKHGPAYDIEVWGKPHPLTSEVQYEVQVVFDDGASFFCWTTEEQLQSCTQR